MEIRQLEYFLMVREAGSFTRAAERLYVSQPAVTNAIRSLEEELGIQLFDRSQKLATLTAEGRIFASHVEKIMHGITTTVEEIHALKNLTSGVLMLGLTPLGGMRSIVHQLQAYHLAFPDIQIALREEDTTGLQQALLEDKIDLAIFAAPAGNPALSSLELATEELVICCSRRHPLHRRNTLALTDLAGEELILLPKSCLYRQNIIEAFEQAESLPRILFEAQSVQTIKGLVAAGCGISILPESLVEDDGELATIPLEPPLSLTSSVFWKTGHHLSHAAEAFLGLIKKGGSPHA